LSGGEASKLSKARVKFSGRGGNTSGRMINQKLAIHDGCREAPMKSLKKAEEKGVPQSGRLKMEKDMGKFVKRPPPSQLLSQYGLWAKTRGEKGKRGGLEFPQFLDKEPLTDVKRDKSDRGENPKGRSTHHKKADELFAGERKK